MELDQVQVTYDLALRRVMADLTGATELRPDVVVDFRDPSDLQYWYTELDRVLVADPK